MAESKKPDGITDLYDQPTNPRLRLSMLAVILSKLEPCRKAQDMVGASEGAAKEATAARYAAIGTLLIWILRDADLADDEERRVKSQLKFFGKKEWIELAKSVPSRDKLPLLTSLLAHLNRLCEDIAKLHLPGSPDHIPTLVTASKDFAKLAAQRIKMLDLPEEHKVIVFEEQTDELRPYHSTAMEAGAEILCKILYESHLTAAECEEAKAELMTQIGRDYLPKSKFLQKLMYTHERLKKR